MEVLKSCARRDWLKDKMLLYTPSGSCRGSRTKGPLLDKEANLILRRQYSPISMESLQAHEEGEPTRTAPRVIAEMVFIRKNSQATTLSTNDGSSSPYR